jgi:hypothetical protein
MSCINSRDEFKQYCLRRLGFPVIDINVDDDQVEDRITDALQYFTDRHTDGTQQVYYIKALEQTDIDNRYLDMSPTTTTDAQGNPIDIVGCVRIFPVSDSQQNVNMFDLRYQLRLNELYDFTSASYINYTLTMQHLRSLEIMFTGEVPIRYNRHMRKLFIDWNWGNSEAPVGQIVVVQCYAAINPTVYPGIWEDRWLKEYATALIKRTWGNNLKKFKGIQLPGGVELDGVTIYNEAVEEIERLEQEMESMFGGVLEFFMN